MKQIKTVTILLIMFFSFSVNAQDKMKEKAVELTKELNTKLGTEKLSADQESKVVAIYLERQNEIKVAKNEITDEVAQKAKIKEIHKTYAKKIMDEILNEKQKAALKEFNKNKDAKE